MSHFAHPLHLQIQQRHLVKILALGHFHLWIILQARIYVFLHVLLQIDLQAVELALKFARQGNMEILQIGSVQQVVLLQIGDCKTIIGNVCLYVQVRHGLNLQLGHA